MAEADDELELARARAKAKIRLRTQAAQVAPVEEPAAAPNELEGGQYLKGAINQLNKGTTLGFGDEIAAGGRTLVDMIGRNWGEEGNQSWADTYKMYRGDERATDKQFQDENPMTSLALNTVGGLISPINRVAPGMGSTGTGLTRAVQATARGAAEGGIVGLGEGEGTLREQLESMETGSLFGGGFGGAVSGVGGLIGRLASNRRIKKELLDESGAFTPIHLAEKEGLLPDFYRNTVGRAWGGKQALRDQEAPFVGRADELVNRAKDESAGAIREVEGQADEVKRGLTRTREQIGDAARADARAARGVNEQIDLDTAQALADDATNFRALAAQEAMPDDYRAALLDVDLNDPVATSQALKKFWNDDAFQMVKSRDFDWDRGMIDNIKKQFDEDPGLFLSDIDGAKMVTNLEAKAGLDPKIAERFRSGSPTGQDVEVFLDVLNKPNLSLPGEALMEMRNIFARKGGRENQAIKKQFDKMILGQLDEVDPASAVAYQDQMNRYATNLNYRQAVRNAKAAGGKFTPKGYLTSGSRFGDYSVGGQPLQREATEAVGRADDVGLAQARAKVDRRQEIEDIGDVKRADIGRAKQAAQDELGKINVKEVKKEAANSVRMAQGARQDLAGRQIAQNPSGISSLVSTALLGAPVSFGVGAVPAGYAVAKTLSTPTAQRTLAGQLDMQKALAKALREGNMAKYTQLASRIAAGQATKKEEEDY